MFSAETGTKKLVPLSSARIGSGIPKPNDVTNVPRASPGRYAPN